jgi:hypothetical protein
MGGMSAFDETTHTRDRAGKFAEMAGSAPSSPPLTAPLATDDAGAPPTLAGTVEGLRVEAGSSPAAPAVADDEPVFTCRHCDAGFATFDEHSDHLSEVHDDDGDDSCSECGADLDDGQGFDGLCGNCADRAEVEGRWS